MFARVVRFTDVDPEHLAGRLEDTQGAEEPPSTFRLRASSFSTTQTSGPRL
jgi:hypothetical protein